MTFCTWSGTDLDELPGEHCVDKGPFSCPSGASASMFVGSLFVASWHGVGKVDSTMTAYASYGFSTSSWSQVAPSRSKATQAA
ncbi:hypothetical protein ABH37_01150 [Mycobacterium haemophilum]|uniref:Uncharacterized protein n=1 Tax=Mycobacterium haemophilum TaxID=29311 RepID=A0A0I9U9T5_9MYCO|nr:hypothetical protein ABH39_01145 [Mycobacterium haemophilum]KLO39006.1 hypothetical protein ABH38_01150 [Mycobacterium haemophilum]KLO45422.1 hypothetical protein ABH37_01150 [Mycobacterium haemophilum]KLO56572.1 hypothetical protein ABH36_01145 [Mycobacterium haemophilum]